MFLIVCTSNSLPLPNPPTLWLEVMHRLFSEKPGKTPKMTQVSFYWIGQMVKGNFQNMKKVIIF